MRLFKSFGLEEQSDLGPHSLSKRLFDSFKADDKSLRLFL